MDSQPSPNHHDHEHHAGGHAPADFGRAFALGVVLNLAFVGAETVFGVLGHSVALLADAAHNLSDVLGLLLAWGASGLSKRLPSGRFTYGLRSSSILAALINAAVLLLVTGGIAWEAVHRFQDPAPVAGPTLVVVAAIGVAVNGATALLFVSGRNDDLNIRGAFLHMAADAAVSLGVVLAGIGIVFTSWRWLDPLVSLGISVVIVISTWGLLRDSVRLALDGVPAEIDLERVRAYLTGLPGVHAIHDLHVWGMSTTETALTVHFVMTDNHPGDAFMASVCQSLRDQFHIGHSTIQVETDPNHACALAPDDVV